MGAILLALVIAWPALAVDQAQQKLPASRPPAVQPKASQPKPRPPKPPELKVVLIGRVENKREPAVQGVDFGSPRGTPRGVLVKVGNCGWMSLTSSTVERVYLAVTDAKDGDGKTIPGLSGQSLRVACETVDAVARFRNQLIRIHGAIREGKLLAGKEVAITAVGDTEVLALEILVGAVKRLLSHEVDESYWQYEGSKISLDYDAASTRYRIVYRDKQWHADGVVGELVPGKFRISGASRDGGPFTIWGSIGKAQEGIQAAAPAANPESTNTLALPSIPGEPRQTVLPRSAKVGQDGVTAPQPLYRVEPKYTPEARNAHVEGTVTLSTVVEADGSVSRVKVLKGLDPGLDKNAVAAVSTWKFKPAEKDGKPVAVAAQIEVRFQLK